MARVEVITLLLVFGLISNISGEPLKRKLAAEIKIDVNKAIFVTNEWYLSLGMDSNLIRNRWNTFNFTSTRMLTMAKALSPAYLRVSGTDADRMTFKADADEDDFIFKPQEALDDAVKNNNLHLAAGDPFSLFPDTNFTMSGRDWDRLNEFVKTAGWRIIFGLNEQLRRDGLWDPTNAMELLDYSIKKGYTNLDFELGNEPDLYRHKAGHVIITSEELGRDVLFLRKMLDGPKYGSFYNKSIIVGPEVTINALYITPFLNTAGNAVSAVTWHHYYGGGELKYVENYTDPVLMDTYVIKTAVVKAAIEASKFPTLRCWQGETSTAAGPPGWDIDMTYVAGFMLLDKLGLNAKLGVELFVRQTFYGFWFALVDQGLHPTPGYWISLLYKRLVGFEVLDTKVELNSKAFNPRSSRFYSHCTYRGAKYPKGAITLYGMNLFDHDLEVYLPPESDVDLFMLSPGGWGGITSRFIALNGQILLMPDENNFPPLRPVPAKAGKPVTFKSKTMAFIVIKNANAQACI